MNANSGATHYDITSCREQRIACCRYRVLTALLLILAFTYPQTSAAQWAAKPGETVRNAFGPTKNLRPSICRGACGLDCPDTCEQVVQFDCTAKGGLLRVQTYSCGTHQGCREHDDCLDRCVQEHGAAYDCQTECHAEAVSDWGLERAGAWAAGGGPFDSEPVTFQYTTDTPDGPHALYGCPDGAQRQCTAGNGQCVSGSNPVEPVFNTFEGGVAGTVQVSGFRSGIACTEAGHPTSICQQAVEISVTGEDQCAQPEGNKRCTWYGFELDYHNAVPGEPLICNSSAIEGDFLGGVVSRAIESANADTDTELGKLLGQFQQDLNSGKSLDSIFSGISVTTADGNTVGGAPPAETFQPPGVPTEVELNTTSGHLLVPIFELHDAAPPGTQVEHLVRCSQQGLPVVETRFRLHFAGG
jgi:hypothetical protein